MGADFVYGHDRVGGWRQLSGPGYLNLPAVVSALGLLDIDPRLGFVGHQPGGFPDWRVFAKPPGQFEIQGLVFDDAEYARYGHDPYRALWERLGLEFVGQAVRAAVPRSPRTPAPVPVTDPEYLPVAYGLFQNGDAAARKKTYWSVLPATGGAHWSPLTWFVSRSEGAVAVPNLEPLFPPVGSPAPVAAPLPVVLAPPAPPPAPAAPTADPVATLAAAVARVEGTLRAAVSGLTGRVDDLAARVAEPNRRPPGTERLDRLELELNRWVAEVRREFDDIRATLACATTPPAPPVETPPAPPVETPPARPPGPRALGIILVIEATLCVIILCALLGLTLSRSGQ